MSSLNDRPARLPPRRVLVCYECKRMKLRCDRQNPCNQCNRRDRVCEYEPHTRTSLPGPLQAAVQELERLLHMKVDANVIRQRSIDAQAPESNGETPPAPVVVRQTDIRGAQLYGTNGFASAISKRAFVGRPLLDLARSVYLLSRIDNKNIAKLIGFAYDENTEQAWILAPPLSYQPLHPYITLAPLSTSDRLHLVHDAANSLLYLHSCTPQVLGATLGYNTNLLVDRDGHLVLSDLSTAVVQDDQAYMALIPNRATHVSFGSEYCSPELISPGLPTPQSDVWAWTCLACKILTGTSTLSEPDSNPVLSSLPALLQCLKSCWEQDPLSRPSIAQCEEVVATELNALYDDLTGHRNSIPSHLW